LGGGLAEGGASESAKASAKNHARDSEWASNLATNPYPRALPDYPASLDSGIIGIFLRGDHVSIERVFHAQRNGSAHADGIVGCIDEAQKLARHAEKRNAGRTGVRRVGLDIACVRGDSDVNR